MKTYNQFTAKEHAQITSARRALLSIGINPNGLNYEETLAAAHDNEQRLWADYQRAGAIFDSTGSYDDAGAQSRLDVLYTSFDKYTRLADLH